MFVQGVTREGKMKEEQENIVGFVLHLFKQSIDSSLVGGFLRACRQPCDEESFGVRWKRWLEIVHEYC